MTTLTLKDSTPTTTITFDSFTVIDDRYDDKSFVVIGIPDNDPAIIVTLLSWVHMIKIKFQLKNDAGWPGSGESAADKWANLVTMLRSGGDNDGQYTITFDREDSTVATPVTESYEGSVRNVAKRVVAGEHVVKIDGNFEFYEGEI